MSTSALPPIRRPRMGRLMKVGLRAASDPSGVKTFQAISREIGEVTTLSAWEAANSVGRKMTPKS